MDARAKRISEDINKLKKLRDNNPHLFQSIAAKNPVSEIKIVLAIPTAADREYPHSISRSVTVHIVLTARYPFDEPKISVISPIWNPNIYRSGQICHGHKWIPTEGLDLLVLWVIRLLAFDSEIINTSSPANAEARDWYIATKAKHPSAFPTMDLSKVNVNLEPPKLKWKNIS